MADGGTPFGNISATKRIFRVGTQTWSPFVIASNTTGTPTITGFCVDLLDIVADQLNFSYTLVLPSDGEWGDKRGDNWTGVMGLLERGEIDLTHAPLTLTAKRGELADWTLPFDYTSTSVAVRSLSADSLASSWGVFLEPLDWHVYVSALCALVCCTCLLHAVVTCQHRMLRHPRTLSPLDVTEVLIGSLLQEAVPHTWPRGAARVIFASWCLAALLLASSYTCKLASLLVDVTPKPPFTSLAEMLQRDDFRWGIVEGTAQATYLRSSRDPLKQEVYAAIETFAQNDPDVFSKDPESSRDPLKQEVYAAIETFAQNDPDVFSKDPEVHKRKVLEGGYAFICDDTVFQLMFPDHEDVTTLEEAVFGLESLVYFAPKHSTTFLAEINSVFLKLQDAGILSNLKSKWFLPRTQVSHDNRSQPRVITIATLQGPLYVTLAGLVLAASVFIIESLVAKRRKILSRCS